ncbi:phosphoglycerate kinase [Candidatus Woesearchaeota archaeon]|nr:phosphoglycerate kinase [Candidatus Woesearchaeota archaeon]
MAIKTLRDMDFSGKKIMVRVDFNVPVKDGKVMNDVRIRKTIPTFQELLHLGATQLILLSHLGRPKEGYDSKLSLKPVAEHCAKLLGQEVAFVGNDFYQDIAEEYLPDAKVVMLENLRFHPGEKKNDAGFAEQLASLADVYVDDAFAAMHRAHASIVGVPRHLPGCIGLLVQEELAALQKLLKPRTPYYAIIGGAKEDKMEAVENLMHFVDKILIGGVLGSTFLKAKGVNIQSSKYDAESLETARRLLKEYGNRLLLPVDVVAAEKFDASAKHKNVPVNNIPDNWMIMDIGEKTREVYARQLQDAKTIVWCGPIGVFEFPHFAEGTNALGEVMDKLTKQGCFTVVGGGESSYALEKFSKSHDSTGGGATLDFIQGKKLPGLGALE